MGDVTYRITCAKCGVVNERDTRQTNMWMGLGSEVQCSACGAVHVGVLAWAFREMAPLPEKKEKATYKYEWPLGQESKKHKK